MEICLWNISIAKNRCKKRWVFFFRVIILKVLYWSAEGSANSEDKVKRLFWESLYKRFFYSCLQLTFRSHSSQHHLLSVTQITTKMIVFISTDFILFKARRLISKVCSPSRRPWQWNILLWKIFARDSFSSKEWFKNMIINCHYWQLSFS